MRLGNGFPHAHVIDCIAFRWDDDDDDDVDGCSTGVLLDGREQVMALRRLPKL